MIPVKRGGIILEPSELEFENQAVFNPAAIKVGNKVHLFYRAVKEGNYSSIGYCQLDGPLKVIERTKKPILYPEFDYEAHGVEDPRIVFLNGRYYLSYMAYNGRDVVTAYATSKDLKNFKKRGPISHLISYAEVKRAFTKQKIPERYFNFDIYDKCEKDTADNVYIWGKDAVIFPKKINNRFAMLHRVLPDIQVIYFNKFKDLTRRYWKKHLQNLSEQIVVSKRYWFESRAVGAGCPPIETKKGWLLIYHAIENSPTGKIYRAAAALLDKNKPTKIIGRLNYPLFSPKEKWELKGNVDNVVFPTGAVVFDEKLYIYYGAADTRVGVVSLNLEELIEELLKK